MQNDNSFIVLFILSSGGMLVLLRFTAPVFRIGESMFDSPIFPIIGRYSGVPRRKNPSQPTLATPIHRAQVISKVMLR